MQPTGSVHNEHVAAARLSGLHGVVDNRAGVSAVLVTYNWHANAHTPGLDWIGGGGAEGVASREQHTVALPLEHVGQFGNARRFADAVDPNDEVDGDRRGLGED